jgi:hypothetical protein
MQNLQELFDTLEAMGFVCNDTALLRDSNVYRALKEFREDRMSEKIPEKIIKRRALDGDMSQYLTYEELEERLFVQKYEKEERPPRELDLWDEMIYEASSLFVETDDNKHDPGVIIQKCLKGVNKYVRARFNEIIGNMTIIEFRGFLYSSYTSSKICLHQHRAGGNGCRTGGHGRF